MGFWGYVVLRRGRRRMRCGRGSLRLGWRRMRRLRRKLLFLAEHASFRGASSARGAYITFSAKWLLLPLLSSLKLTAIYLHVLLVNLPRGAVEN